MNVTCPKSGVRFWIPHFNLPHIYSAHDHPIFSLTTDQLVGLFEHISDPEFGTVDQYLLGLALLSKLPSVWHVAADRERGESLVLANLEKLARILIRIRSARLTDSLIPTIVINKDTRDLKNLPNWIEAYEQAFSDATNNSAKFRKDKQVARLEVTLDALIKKGFYRNQTRISGVVATWAAVTGDFPNPVKSLWQEMITMAFQDDFMSALGSKANLADYDELVEHCEDYIPHGSTLANLLMRKIRDARDMVKEFEAPSKASQLRRLGNANLDDISGGSSSSHAGRDSLATAGVAFKPVDMSGAPDRANYPDQVSFLRDRVRWMKTQQAVQEIQALPTDYVNQSEISEEDTI